ncbi:hypothetical protein BpHYR1_021322, partial [Brachionus plicatilis]
MTILCYPELLLLSSYRLKTYFELVIHNKPFDNSKNMNSLFEQILDFKLNDSIMQNLKESYIDLSALIDLTETDMNQFGITLGGNNMKNDLNKINSFVKEVQGGNGLENFVIEKLVENDIRFGNFLTFDRSDFNKHGTSIGLKNRIRVFQNKRREFNDAVENSQLTWEEKPLREDSNQKIENIKLTLKRNMKTEELSDAAEKTQLKKFLGLKKILSLVSSNAISDMFEIEFNKIILDELNSDDLVECLKKEESLPLQLKPYLLDNLKRIKRFDSIINQIFKIIYSHASIDSNIKQLLELITEKDLVICILESIGYQSLPRLGYLLSKNDYPLPLLYE